MTDASVRLMAGLGALLALLAVAAGAFGAHALQTRIPAERLVTFETGARYQMYHALALFAVAWAGTHWHADPIRWAGALFVIGIVIFSGSLYALSLSGLTWWGAITPIGGLCFLLGWASLAWGLFAGLRA